MIRSEDFLSVLYENDIRFFCGVPDSLLQSFCACLEEKSRGYNNIITANEGNAIALATGYHMASEKIGLVYMQNSGLGNSINPLLSLTDPKVYNIPLLLLIGWRGEPGIHDEPQHISQGALTLPLLETLNIRYAMVPSDLESLRTCIGDACHYLQFHKKCYALIVKNGTFAAYIPEKNKNRTDITGIIREEAIKSIIDQQEPTDVFISTTGKISRELFEYMSTGTVTKDNFFITVGSMGHCSHIALGIALEKPDRTIYCLDGDGSVIMHMGSMGVIGSLSPNNFIHIVLNNGSHDSVGGQPTVGYKIDFVAIAKACGYKSSVRVSSIPDLMNQLQQMRTISGPSFLEVIIEKGARGNLGRPHLSPIEIKQQFMENLK